MLSTEHRLPLVAFLLVSAVCAVFVVQGQVPEGPAISASGPQAADSTGAPPVWVAPAATLVRRAPVRVSATPLALPSPAGVVVAEVTPAAPTAPAPPAATGPDRQRAEHRGRSASRRTQDRSPVLLARPHRGGPPASDQRGGRDRQDQERRHDDRRGHDRPGGDRHGHDRHGGDRHDHDRHGGDRHGRHR